MKRQECTWTCSRPPINRALSAASIHSLARRSLRMMFKFVVLVGFVACAVAAPAPEDAAPVRKARETYNECVTRCGIELGKPQIPGRGECFVLCFPYKRSMTNVVPSEQMKRAIDGKSFEDVAILPKFSMDMKAFDLKPQLRLTYKECASKCAVSGHPLVYRLCIASRCRGLPKSLGDVSLEDDSFAGASSLPTDSEVAPVRRARNGYTDCVENCVIRLGAPWNPTAGPACSVYCSFRRSMADVVPSEQMKKAIDVKIEARISREQCVQACASTGFYYSTCVLTHCNGLSKSLQDDSFASVSSLPTNSASLMQITEPIANILSQVIKKQQELEKMIQSCNCAKPLTPFGLDNGAVGPYF